MTQSMRVSLPGYNALTESNIYNYSIYADSDNVLIKEFSRGSLSVADSASEEITHGLGYIPDFIVYGEDPADSTKKILLTGYPFLGLGWLTAADDDKLYIFNYNGTGGALDVEYFIFYEDIP